MYYNKPGCLAEEEGYIATFLQVFNEKTDSEAYGLHMPTAVHHNVGSLLTLQHEHDTGLLSLILCNT